MIGPDTIEKFKEQGAVPIRGLFADWVDALRRGIEKNMAAPGPFVRDYDDPERGRFFGDYCNWQRIEEYRCFLFESPAAGVAQALMGSQSARLFHEHVLVKEPRAEQPTPWHHDQPYYCVDGRQNCSLWLALDRVEPDSTLEFVAGSHRWDRYYRPERFDKSPLYESSQLAPLPDINAERSRYEILQWALQPGDCVAFHFLTLHGSPGNRSSHRRRAFSSRWVGDDATFAVREGRTSPPFPECRLKHGEALDGEDFPIIAGG